VGNKIGSYYAVCENEPVTNFGSLFPPALATKEKQLEIQGCFWFIVFEQLIYLSLEMIFW